VVQAISFNETSVVVGERVRVSGIVTNEGDEVETFVTGLQVDDGTVASGRIRLRPGESGRVEFVRSFGDPGVYDVGIGSVPAGTVTVERAPSPSPAGESPAMTDASTTATPTAEEGELVVRDAKSQYSWVRAGFNGSVRVTVANPGDRPASRELTVRVEGEPVATRTVTLDPGASAEVTVEFPATEGTVTVEGVEGGELRVGSTAGATESNADTDASSGFGPGFGPVATLLTLVAAGALSAVRRRKNW
jgi:hypothetical protein